MHSVTLLTGSNDECAIAILERAAALLAQKIGSVEASSKLYRSEPWGFHAEREFYNQALRFTTTLGPLEVLDVAQEVERELGRRRDEELREKALSGERYASRVVDVDVMFYDDRVIHTERLTLPHPLLHERAFALAPLCEIMPEEEHPVLHKRLRDIYEEIKQ